MKLVAANLGGLAVAAVVLHGIADSPDARIERAFDAVTTVCDREPQNAGPARQGSSPSAVRYRSTWFNVHVMTGALYGSTVSPDARIERAFDPATQACARDPRDTGPARQAVSPQDAEYRSTWFNVH